jgi:hypothetical protein
MQHRRSAHSRSHIGRASGQISELRVVGKIEFAFERAVHFVHQFECLPQLQTAPDGLHPQMVLFINHHAEGLLAIHDNSAAYTFGRMFATNEMAFYQHLLFESRQVLEQFRKWLLHFGQLFHSWLNQFQNHRALRLFCPPRKSPIP